MSTQLLHYRYTQGWDDKFTYLPYQTKHPSIYPFKISGSARDGESFTKLYKHGHTMAFINGTNSEGKEGITVHDNHLVGDATTQRLVGDAYTRLKRYTCPQSRIFILLRDPVERCLGM